MDEGKAGTGDHGFAAFVELMARLRAPGGCPWDRKQTLATAAHHLQDESAELLEAALAGDVEHVQEELGDLLFMVCFVTEILSETLDTDFDRVAGHANEPAHLYWRRSHD